MLELRGARGGVGPFTDTTAVDSKTSGWWRERLAGLEPDMQNRRQNRRVCGGDGIRQRGDPSFVFLRLEEFGKTVTLNLKGRPDRA